MRANQCDAQGIGFGGGLTHDWGDSPAKGVMQSIVCRERVETRH